MKQKYKVRYIPMTEEEERQWAHDYAKLCLDMYEEKYGPLPPPPSEEEFNRMWDKVMKEKA